MSRVPLVSLCVFALTAESSFCRAADRILFDRLGPTQATIYVSNADGSGERALTEPGSLNYSPSWSPRGD